LPESKFLSYDRDPVVRPTSHLVTLQT